MYPVSKAFLQAVQENTRHYYRMGRITTVAEALERTNQGLGIYREERNGNRPACGIKNDSIVSFADNGIFPGRMRQQR